MIDEKSKRRFVMKKYGVLFIAAMLFLFLVGCDGEREGQSPQEKRELSDFLIVTQSGGIEEGTAKMIKSELENEGYTSDLTTKTEKKDIKRAKFVIFVGVESCDTGGPWVCCSFDTEGEALENTLAPCLSSGAMARAATLLLPDARHFTVLSEKEGGRDVQDACDVFDLCGIDYRAERVESGGLAQCIATVDECGSDAVLIPSRRISSLAVYSNDCPVFAAGEGEPVRGAFATFCVDTELLARDTARLAISRVTGEDISLRTDSYYILCIDRALCEKYNADIAAASEDFKVLLVD